MPFSFCPIFPLLVSVSNIYSIHFLTTQSIQHPMLMALVPKYGILAINIDLLRIKISVAEFFVLFYFLLYCVQALNLILLFLSNVPVSPALDPLLLLPHCFLILHSFFFFINTFIVMASVTTCMKLSLQT